MSSDFCMQFLTTVEPANDGLGQSSQTCRYLTQMSQERKFVFTFEATRHLTDKHIATKKREAGTRGKRRSQSASQGGAQARQEEDRRRVAVAGSVPCIRSGEAQHHLSELPDKKKKRVREIGNRSGRKTTAPQSSRTPKPRRGLISKTGKAGGLPWAKPGHTRRRREGMAARLAHLE